MYDFPQLREAHDALWGALAARLNAAGLADVPGALTRGVGHFEVWRDSSLLFAQGCEYPLAESFAGCVRVVAHPVYSAAGCEGARYRSAIVVRAGGASGAADGHGNGAAGAAGAGGAVAGGGVSSGAATTLADLRGRRCVVNELSSNSGMNLLRAAVAPLAADGRFFDSVVVSGSHRHSVEMVAAGDADVAAIDCVSFAHFQRLYPSVVSGVRVLSWTPSSPSLPFITSRSASEATVQALRYALADVLSDKGLADAREQLLLTGADLNPSNGFEEVLTLEREAARAGYPTIR